MAPALESIEKQQSELQGQYASALKQSKLKGQDLYVDKLTFMRSINRLSNNSVKALPTRNLRSLGHSNSNSDIDRK